jgi:hypothetical protein
MPAMKERAMEPALQFFGKLIAVTSNEIVGIANRASLARFPEPFSHHKFFPRTHPAQS